MRALLAVLTCGAIFLIAMPALAASRTLLLEIWLDEKNLERIAPVTLSDGKLFLAAGELRALNLSLALPQDGADGAVDLSTIKGMAATLDEAGQRLTLSVPVDALPAQLFDLARAPAAPAPSGATGLILRYDVSATVEDASLWGRSVIGGGSLGADFFTADALVHANGFVSGTAAGWRAHRLDTSVVFDDPATLRHLAFGDAITAAPAFARAVRFGGFQFARDFALRPDIDTRPLPQFFGQAAVPGTGDVFSGAALVAQQPVEAGPFTLNNLPLVSGGGTATVVTRDVLGRETTQTLSLYTASDLLAPGLNAYALDLGFLRRDGLRDFAYDTPMLSASWRQGFSGVTLEAHGEAAPQLALLSGGVALALGDFGAAAVNLSAGSDGGVLVSGTARARSGRFNVYASASAASKRYRDLASLGGGVLPSLRTQLGVTTDLAGAGTLGLSWIASHYRRESTNQFLSASWTLPLAGGLFLAATALRDIQDGATSAQVSLAIPLGDRALGSLTALADNDRASGLAVYDNPANPDGGFGYRVLTGWQDGGRFEGDAAYIGPHWAADGGVALRRGTPALRADATGALVLLRGSLFAVHDPGEAVALVQTGEPHIRIYRENRPVAVSDGAGEALITGLNPYAPNHLAVEPRDFSFEALVEKTDTLVAPRRQSGTLVDFRPRSHHPLLAMVTRPMPTPLGARVTLEGDDEELAVGHNGEIFIANLDHPARAVIDLGTSRCRIYIEPKQQAGAMPRTAPLLCLRESDVAY